MSTWLLEINGVKRPLKSWGITAATLKLGNQISDVLEFTATKDLILDFQTSAVLWLDDICHFRGVVITTQFDGNPKSTRRQYTVAGPWWYLENIVYQQQSWVFIDGSDTSKGYTSQLTSDVLLFISPTGGMLWAAGQINLALTYAIQNRAPIAAGICTGLNMEVPWEQGTDLSCAEVIKHALRWTPDAVVWFNYAGAVPVLNISRRSLLNQTSLDLTAGNTVVQLTPSPRWDLLARGVRINWVKTEINEDGQSYYAILPKSAGAADAGERVIIITYKLAGLGKTSESPASGLETEYFSSISMLQWQGAIVVQQVGASGIYYPGNVLNIANGDVPWASFNAMIQTLEEDLFTGKTRIGFGPATQIGIADFLQLRATQRHQMQPPTPRDPQKPVPPPPPAPPNWPPGPPSVPTDPTKPNDGMVKFKACSGGEEITIVAMGYVE